MSLSVSRMAVCVVVARVSLASFAAQAADSSVSNGAASDLDVLTVTATRLAVASFDIPAAISTVSGAQLRNDALGVN
ncbi:MAG: TonB-dependent receptor, partial [Steroidobacteraceae bacterium]